MIIDFHTHLFPAQIAGSTIELLEQRAKIQAYSDGTQEGLLRSMEQAGVDKSVVLPVVTSAKQFDSIFRFAKALNEQCYRNGRELISFGGIHPDSSDYKARLNLLCREGFSGIKLHPDYQHTPFNDIRYKRIVSYASELGMTVVVHAGVDIGLPEVVHCTPAMSAEVIRELAPPALVLAHYGGYDQWDEVEDLLVGQGVYLDTSYTLGHIGQKQFLRILQNHGSERILFATDSPWMGQKESLAVLNAMPIAEEEKQNILYKNALRLLGINAS